MSTLWLLRHGEAEKAPGQSPDDLFSAARDPVLSIRGREQAARARDALAKEPIRAVVASPSRRAQETARIVADPHGLAVITDPRLAELRTGGSSYHETLERILELPERFEKDPGLFAAERAGFAAACAAIAEAHESAIVVAHGLANRAFLAAARAIPLSEMLSIPMEHAQATRIERRDGRWIA